MLAAPVAERTMPVWPERLMVSTLARVRVEIALLLSAPAPLTAIPPAPNPAANATEAARERIVALSVAVTASVPVVARTDPAAPLAALRMIWADVVLAMVLTAVVAAIAPETPTMPPAMLKATAPATASMVALLAATTETAPAFRLVDDPVMRAVVVALMRFSTPTPAPDSDHQNGRWTLSRPETFPARHLRLPPGLSAEPARTETENPRVHRPIAQDQVPVIAEFHECLCSRIRHQ